MKAFTSTTGRVAVIDRPDIDTDQIIPKPFLKRIERTGYGEFLFYDWRLDEHGRPRPEFELNDPAFEGASILLTGRNFGCGSSREHAAWALQDYGFDVVIASSFGDIFRTNASKIGLVTIALPAADVKRLIGLVDPVEGAEMSVDLEQRTITDPQGRTFAFEFDEATRTWLLHGLDEIALTLQSRGRDRGLRARPRRGVTTVAVLPGDGIGPEVTAEAVRVLDALGIGHTEHPFGGNAILALGVPLPDETIAACRSADAVLLGAVGLPELEGRPVRPEQGLLALRKELGVYANLRPARADGIDLVIVRELTGGLYFGAKGTREDGTWFDTCEYTRPEVDRIARRGVRDRARSRRTAHLRRQGERAAHLTAVARRRHRDRSHRLPGRRAGSCARRLVRDDDRDGSRHDRRRPHREHVRRHPLGRRRGGHGRARSRRVRVARRRRPGPLRAGARVGAADRGTRRRQPGGDAALDGPAAQARARSRRQRPMRWNARSTMRSTPHPPRISAAVRAHGMSATRCCARSTPDLPCQLHGERPRPPLHLCVLLRLSALAGASIPPPRAG